MNGLKSFVSYAIGAILKVLSLLRVLKWFKGRGA